MNISYQEPKAHLPGFNPLMANTMHLLKIAQIYDAYRYYINHIDPTASYEDFLKKYYYQYRFIN